MSIECTETIFTADFWCLGAVACKLDRYFAKRWSRMRRRQWLSRSTQAMKHNCSIWKLWQPRLISCLSTLCVPISLQRTFWLTVLTLTLILPPASEISPRLVSAKHGLHWSLCALDSWLLHLLFCVVSIKLVYCKQWSWSKCTPLHHYGTARPEGSLPAPKRLSALGTGTRECLY